MHIVMGIVRNQAKLIEMERFFDLIYLPKGLKPKRYQEVHTTYPIFDLVANTKWVAVFKKIWI